MERKERMKILAATIKQYVERITHIAEKYSGHETPEELNGRTIAVIPFASDLLYSMSTLPAERSQTELATARASLAETIRTEHQDANILILGVSFETLPDAWCDTARFLARETQVQSIVMYTSRRLGQPNSFQIDVYAYTVATGIYLIEHYQRLFEDTAYERILEHGDRLLRDILQPV